MQAAALSDNNTDDYYTTRPHTIFDCTRISLAFGSFFIFANNNEKGERGGEMREERGEGERREERGD